MKFRIAPLLVMIGMVVGVLRAQSPSSQIPSPAEVRALLESSDAKDQAWGAWWAGQGKMREMEPQLQANLPALIGFKSQKEQVALDTTLDAFIQLGTNALPLDLMQSVYSRLPVPALILFSQSSLPQPQVDGVMRTLLHETSSANSSKGLEWFTAADLLLSHRAPGFVSAVLEDLEITGYVVVCDTAEKCEPGRRGRGYGGSIPAGGVDPALPPWPKYGLVKDPGLDSTVFIQGPTISTTMAYRRHVDSGHTFSPSYYADSAPLLPTIPERMGYVAAVAPQLRIPNMDDFSMTFVWHNNPAEYDAEVETFRQGIVQQYSAMILQLRDAGFLNAADAASLATPNLEIHVDNKRK